MCFVVVVTNIVISLKWNWPLAGSEENIKTTWDWKERFYFKNGNIKWLARLLLGNGKYRLHYSDNENSE